MHGTQNPRTLHLNLVLVTEAAASTLLSLSDVFRFFEQLVPGDLRFEVNLVAATREPVATISQVTITPTATFATAPPSDIVIVPSLMLPLDRWARGGCPELVVWLQQQYAAGAVVCSACSGVFPLLEAGLLDNTEVTCHWAYAKLVRQSFPTARLCIEKTLVISGSDQRLVMSGASGSWHDLILYLLTRYAGPSAAQAIARFFLLNWHPEGQLPYLRFEGERDHNDAAIARVQSWLAEHRDQPVAVDYLAQMAGLTERSFKRRFKQATGHSPVEYIQQLRIEDAKRLLEASSLPVDDIARRIGYEETAFFRKLFKRTTAMTPSAYRLKFRPLGRRHPHA